MRSLKVFLSVFAVLLIFIFQANAQLQTTIDRNAELTIISSQKSATYYPIEGEKRRVYDDALVMKFAMRETVPGETIKQKAENYLSSHWNSLGHLTPLNDVLVFESITKNPGGSIVRHLQKYNGLSVDNNQLALFFNNKGKLTLVQNLTRPVSVLTPIIPTISASRAYANALDHLKVDKYRAFELNNLIIHIVNGQAYLAWNVIVVCDDFNEEWTVNVNALNGELLDAENTTNYHNGTGRIYIVPPTLSATTPYGTDPHFVDGNDANNSSLEDELVDVQLLDLEKIGNKYRLSGPNVAIYKKIGTGTFGPWERDDQFDQTTTDFSFTRDQNGFEAVMCYYHIDKSMRYVHDDLGFNIRPYHFLPDTRVRIVPKKPNESRAWYYGGHGMIEIGDGTAGSQQNVDNGEDAHSILHELGHGLHNWSIGSNSIAKKEALNEGVADYWGISNTRDCHFADGYNEWDERYYKLFHWGSHPRYLSIPNYSANKQESYCNDPENTQPGNFPAEYATANWFTTAMMRIYSDLGKEKSDKLYLTTLPTLIDDGPGNMVPSLLAAGVLVYTASQNLNFSTEDQCIIFNHLDDVLCISREISGPTNTTEKDVYMKDTPCDNSTEINPDNGPMWISKDIWLRNQDDGGFEHQLPDFNQESPNYVYVRVRGAGCGMPSDAQLRIYFSLTSTGLDWPATWNDYYIAPPQNFCCASYVLAGDELTSSPINIPNIEPGEEWIVSIPWNPSFQSPKYQYSFLGRIESSEDDMFINESTSVFQNARNNNNVALKVVQMIHAGVPVSALLKDFNGGTLSISSSINTLGKSILELGDIYLTFSTNFYSAWTTAGKPGFGYNEVGTNRIRITHENFNLDGLSGFASQDYFEVEYIPNDANKYAAFDIAQFNDQDLLTGAIRFVYEPRAEFKLRKAKSSNYFGNKDNLTIYPNPSNDQIIVSIPDDFINSEEQSKFDIINWRGQVVHSEIQKPAKNLKFYIADLNAGIYIIKMSDAKGNQISSGRFSKL